MSDKKILYECGDCLCGRTYCGCGQLPNTLQATFTNLEFCGEVSGNVITLTWQVATQDYRGSGSFCSPPVLFTLRLWCVPQGTEIPTYLDCRDYRFDLDADDPVCEWSNSWRPEPGCTCDPFELIFEQRLTPPLPPLECSCCNDDDVTAGRWRVTITI